VITLEQQTAWCRRQLERVTTADPDIDWLDRIRQQARAALARQPVMNRKQEAWRYTSVEKLLDTELFPPPLDSAPSFSALSQYAIPELDGYRLFFYNGQCLPRLTRTDRLPKGVTIGSLRECLATEPELLSPYLGQLAPQGDNLFTALNSASIDNGLLLHVGANVEVDRPIQVSFFTEGREQQPMMVQPRHLIVLERGAKATLMEHFAANSKSRYFHNNLAEIMVAEDATLSHYRLQDEAAASYHLSSLYLRQQGRSRYRATTISFGAGWSRTHLNTSFTGEGAACDLSGLYTVGDSQLSDFHLDVRHGVPACTSREHFKGIAYGQGRAVFDGRVLVERQAQHSDAELKNDNLMLSRNAEFDIKPQLEIHADDVKCGHGTTVGQIEPERMFYLRSRGISPEAARRMLCQGFASEILDRIELEVLRDYAYGRLSAILDAEVVAE
jgi:Fe-S cluster assembly protein SufD